MGQTRKRRRREYAQPHQETTTVAGAAPGHQKHSQPGHGIGDFLCSRCLAIDFDCAFNIKLKGPARDSGKSIVALGDLNETQRISSCQLCRLWVEVRPDTMGPFELRAFPSRLFEIDRTNGMALHKKVCGLDESIYLAVVQKGLYLPTKARYDFRDDLGKTGFICPLKRPELPSSQLYCGRLRRELVDFDLMSTWIEFCRTHHTKLCELQKPKLVIGLRIIDCVGRRIISASENVEYLALSYVWGSLPSIGSSYDDGSMPSLESSSVRILSESAVPRVINDAISVTRALEFRYLWVDRYCIDQDDQAHKCAQIQQMGSIYNNAQATLIAAAGVDPTYGLPGVGSCQRREQPTANIGKYTLCSTLPDPKLLLQKSKWMSRGWTYQEAMLSRRLIHFTNDQVYFECRGMHCREVIPPPLDLFHTRNKQRFRAGFHPGLFVTSGREMSLATAWRRIEAYTKRTMSYDEDAISGILGVLATLRLDHSIYNFWGLPFSDNPEMRTLRQRPRYPSLLCAFGLAQALLWSHDVPARRRSGFPSWSWAGWDGAMHISVNLNADQAEKLDCRCSGACEVRFSAETGDQQVLDWRALLAALKLSQGPENLPCVFCIEAWTVRLRFVYLSEGVAGAGEGLAQPGFYTYITADRRERDGQTYRDCTLYSYLWLSKTADALPASRLEEEEFLGVVPHCKLQDRLLVVESRGHVRERVGMIEMTNWYKTFLRGTVDHGSGSASGPVTVRIQCFGGVDEWDLPKTWLRIRLG